MTDNPILSFEFAQTTGKIKPLTFNNPMKVIVANRIEEVKPALEQVQKAVQQGFYAAGYLSYESAPAFEGKFKVVEEVKMPLLWFGIFSEAYEEIIESDGKYEIGEWKTSISKNEYNEAILAIKNAIKQGETYQTNYTTKLYSQFRGDDVAFFNNLKRAQDSNYCAYLNIGDYSILSASPELFFHLKDDVITTRPMKGTVKRGRTFEEDREKASWLYHSEKDRAENRMIVDLLRNDLGMIAECGSVHVPKLLEVESYPTVHQLTSTVQAKVKENTELIDIFKALFPCGSITGAPKISTMEIISQLETTAREVYCGAIGYITPENEAIFNVPIRTVIIETGSGDAIYGAGGGITWDSTSDGEYEEMLVKASMLVEERPQFQLLESLLLEDGKYFLLDEHIERMSHSAAYFGFPLDEQKWRSSLLTLSRSYLKGTYKVRALYSKETTLQMEVEPITKSKTLLQATVAGSPIDKNNPFYYHKTTNRSMYTIFKNETMYDDVLLWNVDGEITEFTNGNVVVEMNRTLYTPPIRSGLLGGTFRKALIMNNEIQEKVIYLSDLGDCTKVWFINSVRKWVPVEIVRP